MNSHMRCWRRVTLAPMGMPSRSLKLATERRALVMMGFWPVMAAILGEALPATNEGKREMVLRHGVAIWDVIEECDIVGASDASIRNVVPSDLSRVLDHAPIQAIFATGTKSGQLYRRYSEERFGRPITVLPSTSPANATYRLPDLIEAYSVIKRYL